MYNNWATVTDVLTRTNNSTLKNGNIGVSLREYSQFDSFTASQHMLNDAYFTPSNFAWVPQAN